MSTDEVAPRLEWRSVEVIEGTRTSIALDLPPGWWHIRPDALASDVARVVADTTSDLPAGSPGIADLEAELGRLARVSGAAGVTLLAGGAAVDPDTDQVVTACLTVVPHDVYLALDRTGQEPGPTAQLDLTAGQATRLTWLGVSESALVRMLQLSIDYVVVPPEPPSWVLCFQTPAFDHRAEMVQLFDAVAATLRIGGRSTASVSSAFS